MQVATAFVEGQTVKAAGSWQAGGGASGAVLELRIDMDRMQSEWQPGAAGAWEVAQSLASLRCGRHTLRMFAFPTVARGAIQVHCLGRSTSAAQSFTISCAPVVEPLVCTWECAAGDAATCTGTCTAAASGGRSPYRVAWTVAGAERPASPDPSQGPWTESFTCARGATITLTVRNAFGAAEAAPPVEARCGEGSAGP